MYIYVYICIYMYTYVYICMHTWLHASISLSNLGICSPNPPGFRFQDVGFRVCDSGYNFNMFNRSCMKAAISLSNRGICPPLPGFRYQGMRFRVWGAG